MRGNRKFSFMKLVVPRDRIELSTSGLWVPRSNQLSYRGNIERKWKDLYKTEWLTFYTDGRRVDLGQLSYHGIHTGPHDYAAWEASKKEVLR